MAGPGGAVIKSQSWNSDSDLFNAKGWGRWVGFQQDKMGEETGRRDGWNVEIEPARVSLGRSSELLGKRL